MPFIYDAIVAFLCCAGIVATFIALFMPRSKGNTKVAGVIVSEDARDIARCVASMKLMFCDVIVVTTQDLSGVIVGVKVLSPEEFEEYVTGNDKN